MTLTVSELLENFCFMVVEEFLIQKSLISTLNEFRSEWKRPSDEVAIVSWYEVALKLHLPDILNKNNNTGCVIENVVLALIRESSVRTRRNQDAILNGLNTLPKVNSLPAILDNPIRVSSPLLSTKTSLEGNEIKANNLKKEPNNNKTASTVYIKKQPLDSLDKFGKLKISSENWIPEEFRLKSLHRELKVAKETLNEIIQRDSGIKKELKRLTVTDLEKAQVEESLGVTKKLACGCCLKKFLYVNLPLKVSLKAIQDIRIKWSGVLNSATVFGASLIIEKTNNDDLLNLESSTAMDLKNTKQINKSRPDTKNQNLLTTIPKYYDEIRVCVFCAQFFHTQEDYRPSFQSIVYQEKKVAFFEGKKKEQEYWDPLKMCEKDRENQEKNSFFFTE
jgi:hypothetical protein